MSAAAGTGLFVTAFGPVCFGTLLGMGTADTGYAALLFSYEIKRDRCCDTEQEYNQQNINHIAFISAYIPLSGCCCYGK